jgi:hypothetical protein
MPASAVFASTSRPRWSPMPMPIAEVANTAPNLASEVRLACSAFSRASHTALLIVSCSVRVRSRRLSA